MIFRPIAMQTINAPTIKNQTASIVKPGSSRSVFGQLANMVEAAIAARLTDLMSKRSFALALGNLLAFALLGCVMPAVEKISSVFEGGVAWICGASSFWADAASSSRAGMSVAHSR